MPVGTQTQVRQVPIRKNGGLQPVRSVPNRLRVRPEKSDSTWLLGLPLDVVTGSDHSGG